MVVARKEQLVGLLLVEELDVDVAEGIDAVEGSRESKYARQVVGEIVENPFVLGLGELHQRFPEAHAVVLRAQDYMQQLLVRFSEQLRRQKGNALLLGSEGVDEELDDATALLLKTESGGMLEDGFQSEHPYIFIFIPY